MRGKRRRSKDIQQTTADGHVAQWLREQGAPCRWGFEPLLQTNTQVPGFTSVPTRLHERAWSWCSIESDALACTYVTIFLSYSQA
jgi:hypothetical protein